jgi:hypothetical protein
MNIKYDKGNLVLDLHELLQYVDKDSRIEMIESLSCDEEIIRHVADQIMNGFTKNCFSGGSEIIASAEPTLALDRARRDIAKKSSDIAKLEIEKLEQSIKYWQEQYDRLLADYYGKRDSQY